MDRAATEIESRSIVHCAGLAYAKAVRDRVVRPHSKHSVFLGTAGSVCEFEGHKRAKLWRICVEVACDVELATLLRLLGERLGIDLAMLYVRPGPHGVSVSPLFELATTGNRIEATFCTLSV